MLYSSWFSISLFFVAVILFILALVIESNANDYSYGSTKNVILRRISKGMAILIIVPIVSIFIIQGGKYDNVVAHGKEHNVEVKSVSKAYRIDGIYVYYVDDSNKSKSVTVPLCDVVKDSSDCVIYYTYKGCDCFKELHLTQKTLDTLGVVINE